MEKFDVNVLINMIIDLKRIECDCEKNNWDEEDNVLEYNELSDQIIDYLKRVL